MPPTLSDILTHGYKTIRPLSRWCQFAEARNPQGRAVDASAEDACQWCGVGATRRASVELGAVHERFWLACSALDKAARSLANVSSIAGLNDRDDGHAMVLKAFRIAIKEVKASERR